MGVPEAQGAAATSVREKENVDSGWGDLRDVIGTVHGVVVAGGVHDRGDDGVGVENSRRIMILRGWCGWHGSPAEEDDGRSDEASQIMQFFDGIVAGNALIY